MRIFTLLASILWMNLVVAQCDGNRYFNQVFNDFTVTTDIQYGANLDLDGNNVNLLCDIYEPLNDAFDERPLIIIVHGGSFVGGSKEGGDVVPLARDLAKMGYVVASINYRLGLPFTTDLEQPATHAVIRGYHDGKAAIRFFRKTVAEDSNPYGINGDQIFMVGSSAGGFIALHNAYLDDESEIPAIVDQSQPGLGGGIEGESGNPGYSSQLTAIVNIAGAIGDASWMGEDDIPVLSFHGDQDATVPYGTDILTLFGLVDVLPVDGSSTVHARAEEVGVTNCFIPHFGAGHVPHVGNAAYYDTTRSITANFLGHMTCPTEPLDCEYREITLDIPEKDLAKLSVYPNPARETVIVEWDGNTSAQVELYDIQGRFVLDTRMVGDRLTLPISHLNRGTYVLRLVTSTDVVTERLIIH